MLNASRQPTPQQDYPLPWTMPAREDAETSSAANDDELQQDDPNTSVQEWLQTFSDGKPGGSAPPPMH